MPAENPVARGRGFRCFPSTGGVASGRLEFRQRAVSAGAGGASALVVSPCLDYLPPIQPAHLTTGGERRQSRNGSPFQSFGTETGTNLDECRSNAVDDS